MFHYDVEVDTVSIKKAMKQFLNCLKPSGSNIMLVGHNCKVFDIPVLLTVMSKLNILEKFQHVGNGFYDTLPVFKVLHPNQSSYSQPLLFEEFLHETYTVPMTCNRISMP